MWKTCCIYLRDNNCNEKTMRVLRRPPIELGRFFFFLIFQVTRYAFRVIYSNDKTALTRDNYFTNFRTETENSGPTNMSPTRIVIIKGGARRRRFPVDVARIKTVFMSSFSNKIICVPGAFFSFHGTQCEIGATITSSRVFVILFYVP